MTGQLLRNVASGSNNPASIVTARSGAANLKQAPARYTDVQTDRFLIRGVDRTLMRSECRRIRRLVEAIVRGRVVTEVGSTAVRGVIGKQDLDFVVRVDAVDFAETTGTLDGHFNRQSRQRSRPDRAAFDIPSTFDATLHVMVAGCPDDNFETFTQVLRDHRHLRFEYNDLKLKWHGRAMEEYREQKRLFIQRVLGVAPPRRKPDGA
jgi:GrpB-like predicted nucleotidyltransferase (UPF0157 family)